MVQRGKGQGRLQSAKLGFTQRPGGQHQQLLRPLHNAVFARRDSGSEHFESHEFSDLSWEPDEAWAVNLYFSSHSGQMKMFSPSCLKEKQKEMKADTSFLSTIC